MLSAHTDCKSGLTDCAMTLVGPANQNMAQTLGDGLGLVACCSAVLV
jgi:hypothetical protein